MDFSNVVSAVIGWVMLSVPFSLALGAFIGFGNRQPVRVPVSRRFDRAA
jgi:hypothetical protein